MRVNLALGHSVVEPLLGADPVAVPVMKLTVRAVDVDVSACLNVLIALDGAGLLFPDELRCLRWRDSFVERRPMPLVLGHCVDLFEWLVHCLWLDLRLRNLR